MGNIFAFLKQRNRSISISRISSSRSTSASANHRYPSMSKQASSVSTSGTSSAAASATPKENIISSARDKMKKKYSFIPDTFSSLEQVCFSCNFLFFFFLNSYYVNILDLEASCFLKVGGEERIGIYDFWIHIFSDFIIGFSFFRK